MGPDPNWVPDSVDFALLWRPHACRPTIATIATAVHATSGRRSFRSSARSRRTLAPFGQRQEPFLQTRSLFAQRLREDPAPGQPLVHLATGSAGDQDHVGGLQADLVRAQEAHGVVQ